MPPCPKCGKSLSNIMLAGHLATCKGLASAQAQPNTVAALPTGNPKLNNTLSYYSSGTLAAEGSCTLPVTLRQKFDRAVRTFDEKRTSGTAYPPEFSQVKVSDMNAWQAPYTPMVQLIDKLWSDILILKVGSTQRQGMVDPAPGAFQGIPGHVGSFRQLGLCFRCDTRTPDQVTRTGFRRAYEMAPPPDIQGTLPHRAAVGTGMQAAIGMWESNKDAINEMAICVSRNMRGCTKFPFPGYTGPAYIYAIKLPADKVGFDTEAWQQSDTGKLWQPGEKAFYDIAADCILGHVAVQKTATTTTGELHRFQLLSNRWTYTGNAQFADVAVLGPELERLYQGGATQAVMASEDFLIP